MTAAAAARPTGGKGGDGTMPDINHPSGTPGGQGGSAHGGDGGEGGSGGAIASSGAVVVSGSTFAGNRSGAGGSGGNSDRRCERGQLCASPFTSEAVPREGTEGAAAVELRSKPRLSRRPMSRSTATPWGTAATAAMQPPGIGQLGFGARHRWQRREESRPCRRGRAGGRRREQGRVHHDQRHRPGSRREAGRRDRRPGQER